MMSTIMTQRQKDLLRAVRNLERKGLIVSTLDPDGTVRWNVTECGRRAKLRELPDSDESDELLN